MRLLLLLFCFFSFASAYKIMIYNVKFGHSHGNFMGRIADILAEAGHNVTSLIPEIDPKLADGTTKSTIIHVRPDPFASSTWNWMNVNGGDMFTMDSANPIMGWIGGLLMGSVFGSQCRTTIDDDDLMKKLKDEQFDVVITENFDYCGMGIAHVIEPTTTILVHSTVFNAWHYADLGIPQMLSFDPGMTTMKIDVHSMWSRAMNIFTDWASVLMFTGGRTKTEAIFKEKYGPDFPSFKELTSRVAYAFSYAEPLIDFAHPTLHKVIDLGGIGAKEPKLLDKFWDGVLSARKQTVLLSFGSVAKSEQLPVHIKQTILKMVASFPETTFIWKYEHPDDLFSRRNASVLPNLVLSKWMPQNDLLSDPRLSVFISHGGMGSVQETALRGVPAIFIPIFAEQARNAAMMEYNGLGKVFNKFELGDSDKLIATLREVLGNPTYREKAQRASKMLAKKPLKSKELLVKYTEFAARFGASPALRPASVDMSWIEYFNLDIIAIAFVLLLICGAVLLKLTTTFLRCIFSRFTIVKAKQE